jgi:hypothetical protein
MKRALSRRSHFRQHKNFFLSQRRRGAENGEEKEEETLERKKV